MIEPADVAEMIKECGFAAICQMREFATVRCRIEPAILGRTQAHRVGKIEHARIVFELKDEKMVAPIGLAQLFKSLANAAADVAGLSKARIYRGDDPYCVDRSAF